MIGFVWQQTSRNLLPYLTALENVALPMVLDGMSASARETRSPASCSSRSAWPIGPTTAPERMSGGEQQRAAIAVALANRPEVLLADEPTGELDTATAHQIFDLFRHLNRELGVTIVVATHDPLVSDQVNRTVSIRDGRVSSEVLRHRTVSAAGEHHVIATEYAVLDRAGRLQLPRAHVEALGLEKRVRLELEDDHIGVWPDRPAETAAQPRRAGRPLRPRSRSLTAQPDPPQATGTIAIDDRMAARGDEHGPAPRPAPTAGSDRVPGRAMVEAHALSRDFRLGSSVVHALQRGRPARRARRARRGPWPVGLRARPRCCR